MTDQFKNPSRENPARLPLFVKGDMEIRITDEVTGEEIQIDCHYDCRDDDLNKNRREKEISIFGEDFDASKIDFEDFICTGFAIIKGAKR